MHLVGMDAALDEEGADVIGSSCPEGEVVGFRAPFVAMAPHGNVGRGVVLQIGSCSVDDLHILCIAQDVFVGVKMDVLEDLGKAGHRFLKLVEARDATTRCSRNEVGLRDGAICKSHVEVLIFEGHEFVIEAAGNVLIGIAIIESAQFIVL